MNEQVVQTKVIDRIAVLEIDRANKHNALNEHTLRELRGGLEKIRLGPARAVVLAASGAGAFCAGGDIREMSNMSADASAKYIELGRSCATAIEALPVPVIAAVHGHAFGGGLELAMACDVVIAAHSAQFALPEVTLGIIPGFGGIPRLIRRIGYARAQWMVLGGDRVDAHTALGWGLINQSVPKAEVQSCALSLAQRFSQYSSSALRGAKQALSGACEECLKRALACEARCFSEVFSHMDRVEGMTAFAERRKPRFL